MLQYVSIPPGYTIISLDVISLFTNVADYLIFKLVEKLWNQIYNFCKLNCSEFINVISFILHNNYFVPFSVPFYYRYVDDIIICVPERMINYTVNLLNSFDKNLQFTVETSNNNKISFLDILIIQNKQKISTDWYRKPTFSVDF